MVQFNKEPREDCLKRQLHQSDYLDNKLIGAVIPIIIEAIRPLLGEDDYAACKAALERKMTAEDELPALQKRQSMRDEINRIEAETRGSYPDNEEVI
jgi:L-fucose mutarotase/ribose pyranase (RbsD/FucU family)